jgi:CHAT domain-containing protein
VVARRLPKWQPKATPQALGTALLEPFAIELQAAKHVEFMPFGAVRDLDLHALPFQGRALAETLSISYALDVPSTAAPPRTTAIIIADPRGDLPAARKEADAVAGILASAFKVEQLRGLAASPSALRSAAERADILHYAGHGVFKGAHGWESVLPLADGQSVGVGDILALRSAPRLVVLSGCETGKSARGAAEGLGLGQAFVAAGSQAVIAAVRPVPDEAARVLITALHGARAQGISAATALRQAQTTLRTQQPKADWAAFRLLHP